MKNETIKKLYDVGNADVRDILKEEFPSVFLFKSLNWYSDKNNEKLVTFKVSDKESYGFNYDNFEWYDISPCMWTTDFMLDNWQQADPKKVGKLLTEEALRRGLTTQNYTRIISLDGSISQAVPTEQNYYYSESENALYLEGDINLQVFKDGVWAELKPDVPQSVLDWVKDLGIEEACRAIKSAVV